VGRNAIIVSAVLSLLGAAAAAGVLALGPRQPDGGEPPAPTISDPEPDVPDRRIEVNLTTQTLKAYEDDTLVYEFEISSGRRTPAGTYRIWKKHRMKDMKVGMVVKDDYYVIEDVPYIMFYEGEDLPRERGFAIHGAYWHEDFGDPVSHGCINMRVEEARMLFDWSGPRMGGETHVLETGDNPGTVVEVYGSAAGG
jgi:lipoprotein-anchoring transpeptidase ErfK/SrfK